MSKLIILIVLVVTFPITYSLYQYSDDKDYFEYKLKESQRNYKRYTANPENAYQTFLQDRSLGLFYISKNCGHLRARHRKLPVYHHEYSVYPKCVGKVNRYLWKPEVKRDILTKARINSEEELITWAMNNYSYYNIEEIAEYTANPPIQLKDYLLDAARIYWMVFPVVIVIVSGMVVLNVALNNDTISEMLDRLFVCLFRLFVCLFMVFIGCMIFFFGIVYLNTTSNAKAKCRNLPAGSSDSILACTKGAF